MGKTNHRLERGFRASADVYADVSEMVVIDLAPVAPDQNASEYAATFKYDPKRWASLSEFPHQPDREVININT